VLDIFCTADDWLILYIIFRRRGCERTRLDIRLTSVSWVSWSREIK
jgi:hypothetical protein